MHRNKPDLVAPFNFAPSRLRQSAGLLFAVLATPALAGDITVNTTADDNAANPSCSLREAMQAPFNGAAFPGCTGASAVEPNAIKFPANGTCTVPVQLADVITVRAVQVSAAGRGRPATTARAARSSLAAN